MGRDHCKAVGWNKQKYSYNGNREKFRHAWIWLRENSPEQKAGEDLERRKVIYYENELTDEFSTAQIVPKKIDGSYCYCYDSAFKKFTRFFWYRVVATPIAYAYTKLAFHHRVVGREKLSACKTGYFLYGNHTQDIADAFVPTMLSFPRDVYVIVHPNNVSMPVLGKITPSLGALPLPDDLDASRNFMKAVERRVGENNAVVIYPEAHIWPYYTKIRPFPDKSFHYPIRYGVPVFCFTNTYQKRRGSAKPQMVTYIDGPFYPREDLNLRQQKKDLRDRVYACMCQRAKNSNVEVIQYKKKEEENHG